jgi:hypothetical protein
MDTKTRPSRAANHTRKPAAKAKKSDGSLRALLLGIAERGKLIPPEEQAKISRELREHNFCSGTGPAANA